MVSKSFTLIELLVTIFIISLLVTAAIPALRQYQRRTDLKMIASEVRSSILEAKSYSLAPRVSGKEIQSYAIVFKPDSYQIFECQKEADPTFSTCPGGYDKPILESFRKLPPKTNFVINQAEIRFGVVEQGEIITPFCAPEPCTPPPAQIKVQREGEKYWLIEVIKATGAIRICEEGTC